MRFVASWLVALAAIMTPSLVAQQRRVLHGAVHSSDGKALANATVRLVYVARGGECGNATDDRTVVTDVDGRYRVELLPCAPYRVWCLGAPGPDGTRAASAVRLVDSEPFLSLRAEHTAAARQLRIEGLGPWAQLAPFRLRVLPAGIQLHDGEIAVTDGRATIPPLPVVPAPATTAVVLQLLDRRGEVFAALQPDPALPEWQWQIDAPTNLHVRTVDGQGQPVAGVEVFELASSLWPRSTGLTTDPPHRHDWRSLGRSDADGRLRDVPCLRADPDWLARGPTGAFALAIDRFTHENHERRDGDERSLVLRQSKEWRVQLVAPNPTTAAQRTLFAGTSELRAMPRTDDRGAAVFLVGGSEGVAFAAVPDAAWTALLPAELRGRAPSPPVAFSVLPHHLGTERRLDLSWLLQLEVVTDGGSPATRAQVMLGSAGYVSPWSWHAIPDQAGRVAVVATPDDWLVFAHDHESAGSVRVHAKPDAPIKLTLRPLPCLRGRVVDAKGQPVAGAQLQEVGDVWRKEPRPDLDDGLDRVAFWRTADAIARCTTATDGTFCCAFVDGPRLDWTVRFRLGDRQSDPFVLEPAVGFEVVLR